MGLDTELEFDKYCKVVQNPKAGRTSHHRTLKAEVRAQRGKLSSRSYLLRNVDDDFTEISFSRSRSSSCKNMTSVPAGVSGNEVLKRDCMYQHSKEIRKMKKTGSLEERQKIEYSPSSDTSLSFRIFDSSLSDKNYPLLDQKRSPLLSLSEDSNSSPEIGRFHTELGPQDVQELSFRFPSIPILNMDRDMSSDDSLNISMDLKDRKECTSRDIDRGWGEQLRFKCDQTIGPLNDGNSLSERDSFFTLHKSSSGKVGLYSPSRTESDHSKDSPKSRFSPFRRIFYPIMKSKSLRSSPVSRKELCDLPAVGLEKIIRNKTFRKSLLNEFSNTALKTESGPRNVKKDHQSKVVTSSPAHLHGLLTLELKHGVPYFEFSFKDPEDVISAKTWRANNAFSWVYTFHSMTRRRTSNSSGWGTRERHHESSMIGQMQVSCFLLSEMRSNGSFDNSMVTEFVLYDIMQARRTFPTEDKSETTGIMCENLDEGDLPCELNDSCDLVNQRHRAGYASATVDLDSSTHYPWAPADLHPNLEIAAVVIQVPFEKRESLKGKLGDKPGMKEHQNLLDYSAVDHRSDDDLNGINRANIKVVTPAGAHGLPSRKTGGAPSPLLERWRSGGSCDCGGWDMACPLLVFDNCSDQDMNNRRCIKNQQPVELFFQGAKDNMPALTIKSTADGQYSVDFHARLSKLQAFSICVAILHGCEASTAVEQEKNSQGLHCNSLKVLFDEEVNFLIETVADNEKKSMIARA
ncbi:putative bromo-adjacent domain protein [Thalictrum thalictroides]|uniref:Putative bromo-adjacent domain protein n=1 Tax=Thalictrum thalictroides TaxID=46969 RepID=A0A7J6VGJ1_THATH|nr:putative bromo-adjacent domain protein [Thalictrum thalictroides]